MCVLQATTYKVTIYVLHLSEHVLPAALGCLNIHAVRIWTSYSRCFQTLGLVHIDFYSILWLSQLQISTQC